MKRAWHSFLLLIVLVAAAAASQQSSVLDQYTRGIAAIKEKEYRAAVDHLSTALAGAPGHPGLMAELARAEALAGDRKSALARLLKALQLGSGLDVADDAGMQPLLTGPDAEAVREAVSALRAPVSSSQEAFRLAQRDLIPEGIAYDPAGGDFYVGSIHRRKIVRIDSSGQVSDFVPEGRGGLFGVLGMSVDSRRGHLWVATAGLRTMKGATAGEVGRSSLVQYELGSGRQLKKIEMARDPGPHLLNDLVIGAAGDVFVTDSEGGSVWKLPAGAERPHRLEGLRGLAYPNGIELSSDERRLFVAHLGGIAVFDVATGRASAMEHPETVTLTDIDGLRRHGRMLVAVQNGLAPPRIVLFEMDAGEERVVGMRILERGHALFSSIPTTGAIAGEWFYYIANAQLRAFGEDGRIHPWERLQESVILKTRLPAPTSALSYSCLSASTGSARVARRAGR